MSDETELVKAASEGVSAGAVRAALEPFTPPIIETTQTITDLIRYQRWKIQIWIARRARKYLDDRGIEPSTVPLKILVPLLDAASLEDEDDEDMQARWAALLANAAAGSVGAEVLPSFPHILAEMEGYDAQILELLVRHTREIGEGVALAELGVAYDDVDARTRFRVHLNNLERLKLCVVTRRSEEVLELARARFLMEHGHPTDARSRRRLTRKTSPQRGLRITELGLSFIAACTPPTGAQTGAQ